MIEEIDLSKHKTYMGRTLYLYAYRKEKKYVINIRIKDSDQFPYHLFDWIRYLCPLNHVDGTLTLLASVGDRSFAERIVTETIRYDKLSAFK